MFVADANGNTVVVYSIELNHTEYCQVFGTQNAVKERRNGQFFIVSVRLWYSIRVRNGAEVQTPQIGLQHGAVVNGKATNADGSYRWLVPST